MQGAPATVDIAFHNEGPAISPQLLEHLYDPFRRGERRSIGLGLGLYIDQGIALAHGGVWKRSSMSHRVRRSLFACRASDDAPERAAGG